MIEGVRQFAFKNRYGEMYDATRPEALFYDPNGLGWGITPTLQPVGHSYIVTEKTLNTPSPSGSMVFRNYEEYNKFQSFCQSGGLVFCYKPINTWYYLDCYVSINKSEIKPGNNHLVCPVTIYGTSQWYEAVTAFESEPDADGAGKKYSYGYPYKYSGGAAGTVQIENGQLESYFKVTIFGPAVNPFWALYQSGNRIATGKVNVTIPSGHKLVVDSAPATMQIAEYTAADVFVADRYQNSDFTTERIFAIPAGNSEMFFSQDGGAAVNAFVEVRKRV